MRKMKDSGIEWIGEIPAEWETIRIKNLFDYRNEKNSKPLEEVNLISLYTDLGVVQHQDLEATTGNKASTADGYKLVYKDDIVVNIILCWMGAIGRSAYSGVTSPAYDVYAPQEGTNSKFYHYLFRTQGFSGDCYKYGRGIMAMRWRTYSDQFRAIKVVAPPADEQERIVGFLDHQCAEIDAVIAKTKATIEEYKKLKQSLITNAVTKGIRGDRPMKDSGVEWIGDIPTEWNTIKFKYLHNGLNTGEAIDKEFWSNDENDTVFYTAGLLPIHTNYQDFPEWKYTTKNDLLLARNGTPYVYYPFESACYTDHIIRATIKDRVYKRYLQFSLQQSISSVVVNQVSIATWSASLWNEQTIPWPSFEEQVEIADYLEKKCDEIDTLIEKKTALLAEMESYKKSVIYEYVTGKKEVL